MSRRTTLLAVSALALTASASLGQGTGTVLRGAEAFGDWREDAPGVTRHITAGDLPPEASGESESNSAQPVPRPDGALPSAPEGFDIEAVITGIENPRAIRFAPNGDLFVANSELGEVRAYRFGEGGGAPTEEKIFADGLEQPYGIAFYPAENPQWVYVAEADGLKRFAYAQGDLEASVAPEALVDNIPAGGHWTRDIVFSADGQTLYYSVGSESNVAEGLDREPEGGLAAWAEAHPLGAAWGEEERRAAVLAFDAEGKNERIFATGLRNCSGMTRQPQTGQVWCVVNERDALGDNVPFEYATHVEEGAFYGWPWYYIGSNEDPRWAGARPDLAEKVTVPDVLFQAHSAPLGITFYDGEAFGPDYAGDAFVAMHGSWNRGTRTGYKVVRVMIDESGKATGEYQDFVTGFVLNDNDVWGRPVGLAVAPDGALFFSDDGSGTIWRVSKE